MNGIQKIAATSLLGVVVLVGYVATFPQMAQAFLGVPTPTAQSIIEGVTAESDAIFSEALDSSLQNPPAEIEHGGEAETIVCDTFGTLGLPGGCGSSGDTGGGSGNEDDDDSGNPSGGDNDGDDTGEENHGGGDDNSNDDESDTDEETTEDEDSNSDGTNDTSSGGSSSGGGGGGIPSLFGVVNDPYRNVTGGQEQTQCAEHLTGYVGLGKNNDSTEVMKLQSVLRDIEGFDVLVTGIYDNASYEAVRAFQLRYASEVLEPWGIAQPTGYVYYTTKKKINEVYCNNQREFPLTDGQQEEIIEYRIDDADAEIRGLIGSTGGTEVAQALAAAEQSEGVEGSIEVAVEDVEDRSAQTASAIEGAERSGMFGRIRSNLRSFFGGVREMMPF
jgi:hypothetical protein